MLESTHRKEKKLLELLAAQQRGEVRALQNVTRLLQDGILPRDSELAGVITALLKHPKREIKIASVHALGKLRNANDRATPSLKELAYNDADGEVASAAITALGRLGTGQSINVLSRLLSLTRAPCDSARAGAIADLLIHPAFDVKMAAIFALGRLGAEGAKHVDRLTALARNDEAGGPAYAAISVLSQLGTPESLSALLGMMNDPKLQKRGMSYFKALGAFKEKGEAALPVLKRFILNSSPKRDSDLIAEAREALSSIQCAVRDRNVARLISSAESGNWESVVPQRTAVSAELSGFQGELVVDKYFLFQKALGASCFRINIFKGRGGRRVGVLIVDDHSSPDIQVNSEYIAMELIREFKLSPRGTSWIEHWDSSHDGKPPRTLEVRYEMNTRGLMFSPTWHRAQSLSDLLRRLGVKYKPKS